MGDMGTTRGEVTGHCIMFSLAGFCRKETNYTQEPSSKNGHVRIASSCLDPLLSPYSVTCAQVFMPRDKPMKLGQPNCSLFRDRVEQKTTRVNGMRLLYEDWKFKFSAGGGVLICSNVGDDSETDCVQLERMTKTRGRKYVAKHYRIHAA